MDHHHGYSNLHLHFCVVCFQRGCCGDCLPIPSLPRDDGLGHRIFCPEHLSWSDDFGGKDTCSSISFMILLLTSNSASRPFSELFGPKISTRTSLFLFAIFYTPVALA